jgi:Phosphotransferase enzyme family
MTEARQTFDGAGSEGDEVPLSGGRLTPGVVRVGEAVRRRMGDHSPFVHDLLRRLDRRGFEAAPRFLGVDRRGREVLSFRAGWVPPNLEWRRWTDEQVVAAARLVRELHDATEGLPLCGGCEVVCHGDLSPCNFVFVDRRPRFLIDFDSASPGTRRADVAYMAWMWLVGHEDPGHAPPLETRLRQMRLLLDTYGLADRDRFGEAIRERQLAVRASTIARGSLPSWVDAEIAFLDANATQIDAALD